MICDLYVNVFSFKTKVKHAMCAARVTQVVHVATVRLRSGTAMRKRGKVWRAKRNYCPTCFVKKAKKVNESILVFEVRNKEDFKAVFPQQRRRISM